MVVTPFLNPKSLISVFENSKAIIIEAYGAGNIPKKNIEFV